MVTANRADTLFRREGVIEMHGHAAREEKSLRHALAGKEVEKIGDEKDMLHILFHLYAIYCCKTCIVQCFYNFFTFK